MLFGFFLIVSVKETSVTDFVKDGLLLSSPRVL